MCGIYGMVALDGRELRCPQLLDHMGRVLRHRGPDGRGSLVEPRVAFGAERLRIVDPSPAGDQPFSDPESRIWLVCNGEVYNAPALRRRYAAFPFRSGADVEAVVPLYLDRGVAGLADLEGMFAIALYDFRDRSLLLARDPAGEKPLFYTRSGGELWFGSEVQALLPPGAGIDRSVDPTAAQEFLCLGYVREPRTLHLGIRKVEAGTALVFSGASATTSSYGVPPDNGEADQPRTVSLDALQDALERAVEKQVTVDGPLGVFASGGVDSGLLAANAVRAVGRERVHLFTVGFTDRSFDESDVARRLADHLGTRHTVVVADDASLLASLRTLVERVAEPIADPAVLPTYLLARAAKEHVQVVLGGEGADELFGGYPTYLGHRAAAWYSRIPAGIRRGAARVVTAFPVSHRKMPVEYLLKRFVAGAEQPTPQRHLTWFGTGLPPQVFRERATVSPWRGFPSGDDDVRRASAFDYSTYLRDNLLVKIDRATMLCALEARAPYLDPDVVRLAQRLAARDRVRGFSTKWALKRVAAQRLPRQFVRRVKRGLSVPVSRWLHAGLWEEVDRLLAPQRIERRGLLRGDPVWQLLLEHRSGRADHSRALWPIVMLEYWMERWGPEVA